MIWILLWIMPLVQDRSLDLLTSNAARYYCTTDASSKINFKLFYICTPHGADICLVLNRNYLHNNEDRQYFQCWTIKTWELCWYVHVTLCIKCIFTYKIQNTCIPLHRKMRTMDNYSVVRKGHETDITG